MNKPDQHSQYSRRVAFVVSSVGFHWEEMAAAYRVLSEAGVQVQFFTPAGKPAVADPKSLVPRKFLSHLGMGSPLDIAPLSEFGKNLWQELKKARAVIDLNPKDFSGIYLPGGHGCLFDLNTSPTLQNRILEFYQSRKPMAAVCHATSTFAFVQDQGVFIVEGKSLTGFSDLMDELLTEFNGIDKSLLPIPFSNDIKLLAARAKNPLWQRAMAFLNPKFFVVDLPFITGVGPKAATAVAKVLLSQLK